MPPDSPPPLKKPVLNRGEADALRNENKGWIFGDAYAGLKNYKSYDSTFSGFQPSKADYDAWLRFSQENDPAFTQLISKYGTGMQAYLWEQYITGAQEPNLIEMEGLFPGVTQFGLSLNRGPGGGGGGRKPEDVEAEVRNLMATLGYTVVDSEVKEIAAKVVNEDWSGAKLQDHLLRDTARLTNPGSYSETVNRVKNMAAGQLVSVSDATAADWAKRLLSSELDMTTVQNIFAQQATNEFGWAADALTTGATMRDILAPLRDTVARELEINADDVNLMEPKWRDMVQVTNEDNTKRAASLTEAVKAARKDVAYANTAGGARSAAEAATMLRRVFEGN